MCIRDSTRAARRATTSDTSPLGSAKSLVPVTYDKASKRLAPTPQKLQALDLLLTNGSVPLTLPMDSTEKLIEKLVERRMQNTGESQAVATANVMAAFEKLKKDKTP